jgi:hypothetical protein
MANKLQGSVTYTATAYGMTPYGLNTAKALADIERLRAECRNIMNSVYSPTVIVFMIELATKRGRLKQLRDLYLWDIRQMTSDDW